MRIRTIKPEFWSSEGVASVSIPARLTFIGLWCCADDHGNGKANPKLVKSSLFPLDQDVSADDVEMWITELESAALIFRYEADDRVYFCIPSWEKHQAAAYRRGEPQHPAPTHEQRSCVRVQISAGSGTGNIEQGREQGEEGNRDSKPRSAGPANPITHDELYLAEKIGSRWGKGITPAAIQKLNTRFGTPAVESALRELHGFPPEDAVREPFAYLEAICAESVA